jgi:hypothetical protein
MPLRLEPIIDQLPVNFATMQAEASPNSLFCMRKYREFGKFSGIRAQMGPNRFFGLVTEAQVQRFTNKLPRPISLTR